VGFNEKSRPVAHRGVGIGEHGPPDTDDKTFFRMIIIERIGIGADEQILRRAPGLDTGQKGLPRPSGDSPAEGLMFVDIPGEEILIIHAVGGVAVIEEVRHPAMVHLQPMPHFRRIGFHKIAVQIEARRGGPPAHLLRAVLIDAIVGRESFVSVHVKDGDDQKNEIIEQVLMLFVDQQVTRQQHHRVLAVALAAVNGALNKDDRFAGPARFLRSEGLFRRDDQQGKRTPLGALAEGLQPGIG